MLPARSSGAAHTAISNSAIVVRNISVLRVANAVEIHIEASGGLNPVSGVLSHPDRILVDLPNVSYDRNRRVEIGAGDIKDLRVALFQAEPPITRVVVDLEHPHRFTLQPGGSVVVLRIETAAPEASRPAPQAPLVVPSVAPANREGQPVMTPQPPVERARAPVSPPPAQASTPTPTAELSATQEVPLAIRPISKPAWPAARVPEVAPPAAPPEVATLHLPPPPRTEPSLQPQDDEDTTPHQAAKEKARPITLQNVRIARQQEDIEIHIETSRGVQPLVSTAGDGKGIILDLPGVTLRDPRRISVNAHGVQDVSVSLFVLNPPITRILVNLTANRAYHLLAIGNTLTLRITSKETQVGEKR